MQATEGRPGRGAVESNSCFTRAFPSLTVELLFVPFEMSTGFAGSRGHVFLQFWVWVGVATGSSKPKGGREAPVPSSAAFLV